MEKMTVLFSATSRGESAHTVPRASSGSAFERVRVKTVIA